MCCSFYGSDTADVGDWGETDASTGGTLAEWLLSQTLPASPTKNSTNRTPITCCSCSVHFGMPDGTINAPEPFSNGKDGIYRGFGGI